MEQPLVLGHNQVGPPFIGMERATSPPVLAFALELDPAPLHHRDDVCGSFDFCKISFHQSDKNSSLDSD